jgi:hypothetical protein
MSWTVLALGFPIHGSGSKPEINKEKYMRTNVPARIGGPSRRAAAWGGRIRFVTLCSIGAALLALCPAAYATTFTFNTDPFAGTDVLNTPGRQIVANESFINFNPATDVFSLESTVFSVGTTVNFVNASADNLPAGGVNVIVLDTFDNDNNPATPFGAGNAADLIASHITTPGSGFFIYFNQTLNLPRLVFSEDLSSNTSDLKVLARMLNLTGQTGMGALPDFTAANFAITTSTATPEPSSLSLFIQMCVLGVCWYFVRRRMKIGLRAPTGFAKGILGHAMRKRGVGAVTLAILTSVSGFSAENQQGGKKNDIEFIKVVDSTTQGFTAFDKFPAINNHGEVAFVGVRNGDTEVFRVRAEGENLTPITNSKESLFAFGGELSMNSSGVVAFDAITASNSHVIFKSDGITKTLIADSAINGLAGPFMGSPAINAAGTVAFFSLRAERGLPASIFTGSGGPLTTVAMSSPTGFSTFSNVAINDFGTIVFGGFRTDGSVGLFTLRGNQVDIVDTNTHPEFFSFGDPVINNAGTIADVAFLNAGPIEIISGNTRGITLRTDPKAAPFFTNSEHPSINNSGAVAFYAMPTNPGDGGVTGIFLEVSGGHSLIPIIKPGDSLFGSTVVGVDLGRFALNDRFQMVFSYNLNDGRSGLAIASFNGENEEDERQN